MNAARATTGTEARPVRSLIAMALGMVTALLLALPAPAEAVQVGEEAPDFKLPATTGEDIRLSDYEGKSMVLLEFYHADFGPT